MNDYNWILQVAGRFHPLLIHFPIGLLVVALIFEFFTIGGRRQGLREGISGMVYFGGTLTFFSAISGWLLRTNENYSGDLVSNHQLMGVATAIAAIITIGLLSRSKRKKETGLRLYRLGLFTTVILLSITGHFGASLTHGEDYLSSVLPGKNQEYDDEKAIALLSELNKTGSITEQQQNKLNIEVRAIFAHNCYQCHSENKQKGELVLENKKGVFKGGESGAVIVPGNPAESELYKRITLPPHEDGVMPKKGKVLKKNEITLIEMWIKNGAPWSDESIKVFPEAELALVKPVLPSLSNEVHPVDKFVDVYFKKEGLEWPEIVNDQIFIKRAYMDIVGLLPQPEAISNFLNNLNPDKRTILIDSLLGDDHNYTQHWLSFWNDLLRNDYSGPGFITGGRKQITNWLYTALNANMSYDQMIKELVNPDDTSEGFINGIQWRGVVNASQRTEMQAAQNIGQSLMGVNVKCASCHNSFVSNVTLEQAYGFASIFADTLLEMNRCDKPLGKRANVNFLYPELGSVDGQSVQERLSNLSNIMVKPENGRLYRTITNRIWDRLMGRGIIKPLDEMDNTPWNADLLDWLAADFIESNFDLKHLIKEIMLSKTYQLHNVYYKKQEDILSNYKFKGPIMRRLSAEQFCDAISQVISPVFASVEYNPTGEKILAKRIWHPEVKYDRTVLPEPGKRYFRKYFDLPKGEIKSAKILISVDHAYTLYLNGFKISSGEDWKIVGKVDVEKFLLSGKNIIAIEGENEGKIANPAGILFSLKVEYGSGETLQINSNISWKSTDERPENNWKSTDFDDSFWKAVQNYGEANWGELINFTFNDTEGKFARACLVKQHPFMKALGRPSRENVTTSRDQQATLLQALELTNGEFFNSILENGAIRWLEQYDHDSEKIIVEMYQQLLGRRPSLGEKEVLMNVLGNNPQKEDLQDVFWSVLILPEFQFIS
jgi:uncharacterized membrane protein/mono/diheme cytochrome c family protein